MDLFDIEQPPYRFYTLKSIAPAKASKKFLLSSAVLGLLGFTFDLELLTRFATRVTYSLIILIY